MLTLAREAEDDGWGGFFLWDHLLLYRHSDIPFVDAWIELAAIAARTERFRLGSVITPVARRRPWKLAREVVSLDHLSQGRTILGVGLGAPADAEFECFGEDPDDQVAMVYRARSGSAAGATMNRKPGQRPTLRTPDPGLNDRVHLNLPDPV